MDSVIKVCGAETLLDIVLIDYLTPENVGDRFPFIFGGIVSLPAYAAECFAVIGVLLVAGSVDSVINDFFDYKVVGAVFVGIFVVIWLMMRVFFWSSSERSSLSHFVTG